MLLAPEGVEPAWGRSYTLHEGYQSCEAGHGEGAACSHKGVSGWGEVPLYTVITDPRWAPDKRDYAGIRSVASLTMNDAHRSTHLDLPRGRWWSCGVVACGAVVAM